VGTGFPIGSALSTATAYAAATGGTLVYNLGSGTNETSGSGGPSGEGGGDDTFFWPWVPETKSIDTHGAGEGAAGEGESACWPWTVALYSDAQGLADAAGDAADPCWPWLGATDGEHAADAPALDGVFSTLDNGSILVCYDGRPEVSLLADSLHQHDSMAAPAAPALDAIFARDDRAGRLPDGDGATLPAAAWTDGSADGRADHSDLVWAGLMAAAIGVPLARRDDKERRGRAGR
jgi:hypothetical protein